MSLPSVTALARMFITEVLHEGGVAVDATVGNGHDTLFLAQQVGPAGRVYGFYGFDVQAAALDAARGRLGAEGVADRVQLFQAGHETMRRNVPRVHHGKVQAVTFNLGFLPGGPDKDIVTQPETTLAALEAAADLLAPSGILTAVLYPAHPGGRAEADRAERWAARLSHRQFDVYQYRPFNARRDAPRLLAVSRRERVVSVVTHERPHVA